VTTSKIFQHKEELDEAEKNIDRAAENAELKIEQTAKNAGKELKEAKDKAKSGEEYIDDYYHEG